MAEHGGDSNRAGAAAGAAAPHGRRTRRVLGWASIALAVVLVAGVLTGYAFYRNLFGKIHQVSIYGLGKRPPGYNHSLNVLVIGSDSRRGANHQFGASVTGQRSDTILVLHLSPGFRRAVVLSIPRDSVVPVLSCPKAAGSAGQVAQPGQIEQINATFAYGGPGCLWKTIEHTTHIRLDHFIELNFTGFENVINDLGGVDICLPFAINNRLSKLHLSRGLHHVMGAQALAYWRVRYIGEGSDLQRIVRDQYLMASVAQKIKQTDLLGDPARLYRVVSDVASSLTTDSALTQSGLISLAYSLRKLPLREIHFVQVPVLAYAPNPNWVQWAPSASVLFHAIAHDRKLPRSLRRHHRRAPAASHPSGSSSASASPTAPGTSPRPHHKSGGPSGLDRLGRTYGGISARANVCKDTGAFAGPLGRH